MSSMTWKKKLESKCMLFLCNLTVIITTNLKVTAHILKDLSGFEANLAIQKQTVSKRLKMVISYT